MKVTECMDVLRKRVLSNVESNSMMNDENSMMFNPSLGIIFEDDCTIEECIECIQERMNDGREIEVEDKEQENDEMQETPLILYVGYVLRSKKKKSVNNDNNDNNEVLKEMVRDYKSQMEHLNAKLNDKNENKENKVVVNENVKSSNSSKSRNHSSENIKKSRVMIVKSKISSEIQRGARKMVEYGFDSPFWWNKVRDSENRIRRLGARLKKLCDIILDLCSVTLTFSDHCNKIHLMVKQSWEEIENEYAMDILSLNAQFMNLGEQLHHMCSASAQLSVTMKAVLVDAFRDFNQNHLTQVNTSSKALKHLSVEYDNALKKLLHCSQNLPAVNIKRSKKNAFLIHLSSSQITDQVEYKAWMKKTEICRRDYELKRFDHCQILNAILNRHRYELILNLCACFSGFETFFHVGYESSLSHKVFHRSIQMGVAEKTSQEDINDKLNAKKRKSIAQILDEGKDYNKIRKQQKLKKHKQLLKIAKKKKQQIIDNDNNNNDDDNDDESDTDSDDSSVDEYDIDSYSGWLWKQSSNMKKDWKRRWFVLENGELGYYRRVDRLEREFVVNTMLCKVKSKPDHEYRYVFELISPSRRVYTLQAESPQDFIAWTSVLRNQVHRMLRRSTHKDMMMDNSRCDRSKSQMEIRSQKRELKQKIQITNKHCADCGKRDPEWVSINTGVIICIGCCGVHRGLGTHVSKVRSLVLDDIPQSTLELLLLLGNTNVNNILEHSIPNDYHKIHAHSVSREREKFIKGKYMFRLFVNPDVQNSHLENNLLLYQSSIQNDILGLLNAMAHGANLNFAFSEYRNRTVLHESSLLNYSNIVELLLQNGASQHIEDEDGKTARELAEENECLDVIEILEYNNVGYIDMSANLQNAKFNLTHIPNNNNNISQNESGNQSPRSHNNSETEPSISNSNNNRNNINFKTDF